MANTSAPARMANWTAASPNPPAAAWIRMRCPASRLANRCRPYSAVRNAIGIPAASVKLMAAGFLATKSAGRLTKDCRLAGANATTVAPTCKSRTSEPTLTIVPAHSAPGVPVRAGNIPSAVSTSRKFRPDARTSISTSSTRGAFRVAVSMRKSSRRPDGSMLSFCGASGCGRSRTRRAV